MESGNKKHVLAAVAGVVVGAGAVIASVIALKDRNNRQKLKDVVSTAKERATEAKENIKRGMGKAIAKAEKVTKSVEQEVNNL